MRQLFVCMTRQRVSQFFFTSIAQSSVIRCSIAHSCIRKPKRKGYFSPLYHSACPPPTWKGLRYSFLPHFLSTTTRQLTENAHIIIHPSAHRMNHTRVREHHHFMHWQQIHPTNIYHYGYLRLLQPILEWVLRVHSLFHPSEIVWTHSISSEMNNGNFHRGGPETTLEATVYFQTNWLPDGKSIEHYIQSFHLLLLDLRSVHICFHLQFIQSMHYSNPLLYTIHVCLQHRSALEQRLPVCSMHRHLVWCRVLKKQIQATRMQP